MPAENKIQTQNPKSKPAARKERVAAAAGKKKAVTPTSKTYDVGILGWWYGKNYGSILTYYGLNRAIENLGYKVLMVHEPLGYNGYRVSWPDDIVSMQFAKRVGYAFTGQEHYSKIPALNDQADTFIVGSDQLWNPLIGRVNDDLFLDFVAPENRRIAYGTSFGNKGTDKFDAKFVEKHAKNLQEFSAISVREDYAIETARDVFGVQATQVADPVFLLPQTHYQELADKASIEVSGDYLAVFYLDPTEKKKNVADAIASKLGLNKIVVIPNPDEGREASGKLFDGEKYEIIAEDSPENFLRVYSGARYVITDSFHGSAFSAIFEKPFSSIYNTRRGADRFKSLMSSLGLGNSRRVLESDTAEKISENPNVSFDIDLKKAKAYIRREQKTSLKWLETALAQAPGTSVRIAPEEKQPPRDKSTSIGIDFKSDSDAWTVTREDTSTLLTVEPGKSVRGKPVWLDLPKTVTKGRHYRLSIDWKLFTTAKTINFHLRESATGKFKVIGGVEVGERTAVARRDTVDFLYPEAAYDQVMVGALHFTGARAGAIVEDVRIEGIEASEVRPARSAKPKAAPSGNTGLAIPPDTPDRATIIANILADKTVLSWKSELTSLMPGLTFYVAREMKEYTNNKVGGPADILAFPGSADELATLVQFARSRNIPTTILGRGTNVIVRDGGIRGIVISTIRNDKISVDGNILTVGAGASLIETCYHLLDRGKSGLEWAAGIPGTVGGAVFMNAGTNVSDIRRTIRSVKVLTRDGQVEDLSRSDIAWGKRYTTFQDRKDLIVLEATFTIEDLPANDLHKSMIRTVQVREDHFPLQNPNHGSTFKWWRAPRLISQAGLVGVQIGGAQVSTKQPGFIVNVKQATASDFEALINLIIARVYEFSGFLLEPEVEIIGERPHRYERYQLADDDGDLDKR